jgi:hypothetical protein
MHGATIKKKKDAPMLGALNDYTNALDKHKLHLILRWASTLTSLSAVYTADGVLFLIRLLCTFNGTSTPISWCLAVLNNSPFPVRGLMAQQFT